MALISCTECGKAISSFALSCPQCGMPQPQLQPTHQPAPEPQLEPEAELKLKPKFKIPEGNKIASALSFAFMLVLLISWLLSSSTNRPTSQTATNTNSCNADDLQCLGDKGVVAAGVHCPSRIEKLATHSVKWTDQMLVTKFSRFRWEIKNMGLIAYIGDKAEFQNGYGAFTPVIYECVLSRDNTKVLDVSVREGRLPAD